MELQKTIRGFVFFSENRFRYVDPPNSGITHIIEAKPFQLEELLNKPPEVVKPLPPLSRKKNGSSH